MFAGGVVGRRGAACAGLKFIWVIFCAVSIVAVPLGSSGLSTSSS